MVRHFRKISVISFFVMLTISRCGSEKEQAFSSVDFTKVEDGIHVATGLIDDEGLMTVIGSCTPCHSAKLITQNRATREGWLSMIRWMQATQNLWDLGERNEEIILDYLARNYAPEEKGRRAPLTDIEWYQLDD